MIHMWFTGINYYKLAVEKDRDSKADFHCSRFARAGGANITQLPL
jgi:hypothetical protein